MDEDVDEVEDVVKVEVFVLGFNSLFIKFDFSEVDIYSMYG